MDEEKHRLGAPALRQLRAAVDENTALRLLSEGWWRRASARFRGVSEPVKSERVWAPAYLVTIPMAERGIVTRFQCSVDGLSGAFALFGMGEAIEDAEAKDAGPFSALVAASEADAIARAALVAAILRRRRKSATAQLGETESVELLRWPYWVFYYRRRNGSMDIRVIDAATGDRVGHKIKLGLLEAFRAAAGTETTLKGK